MLSLRDIRDILLETYQNIFQIGTITNGREMNSTNIKTKTKLRNDNDCRREWGGGGEGKWMETKDASEMLTRQVWQVMEGEGGINRWSHIKHIKASEVNYPKWKHPEKI